MKPCSKIFEIYIIFPNFFVPCTRHNFYIRHQIKLNNRKWNRRRIFNFTKIITSEKNNITIKRAKKLKVDFVHQGLEGKGKLEIVQSICKKNSIPFDSVSYIGDDINCFELLSNVKYAACPSNAVKKIKEIPNILQLKTKGGDGAVREYLNYLLENKLI